MEKSEKKMLIYGAAGYTGKIIAERAKELGLNFEIAGRGEDRISEVAHELGVGYHIFTVDDENGWEKALSDKHVLINTAGPFTNTAQKAIEACLKAKVHYLDISAEMETYLLAESLDSQAKEAEIQLISGAGLFVSYDALAVHLAQLVDEPQKLSMGFRHYGGFSKGSVLSSKNIADLGILVRKDNEIQENKDAQPKSFSFGKEDIECIPTPLGGIILTYKSTGIPNIEEYFSLKLPAVDIPNMDPNNLPDGPTKEERAAGRNAISGEIIGKDGKVIRAMIDAPSGYTLTPISVVAVAHRILKDDFKTGYQSPGSSYGAGILNDLPETYLINL